MPRRRLLLLAARMAYRDVRASPAKFLATLGFVAVAAAGVFAARGITTGVEDHLADQSREWIAADAAVVYFGSPPTEEQWNIVQRLPGVQATLVTEGGALVTSRAAADPATVALKAVDPATYPFYGRLGLMSRKAINTVLGPSSAIISSDLQDMLAVRLGDVISIRGADFHVRDILTSEPDRFLPAQMESARVLISQQGLARTGLFRFDPAYYRLLIRTAPGTDTTALLTRLEETFPQAEVVDHTAPTPQFTAAIDGLLPFLDVLAFLTLAAGCIAIAVATYFRLLASLDAIAMLKAVGATSSQIMAIYWLQILLAAIVGIGVGILGGEALQIGIVDLVGRFLDIHLKNRSGVGTTAETALLCLLAATSAPWLPLMRIRRISALRLQRRDIGEKETLERPAAGWAGLKTAKVSIACAGILVFGWIVPAWDARVFLLAAFCAVAALLRALSKIPAPRALSRPWFKGQRGAWPVRHGIGNLFRYRRQSSVVVLALAIGTALMVAAMAGVTQFTRSLISAIPLQLPQLLLVNVSGSDKLELSQFLVRQPGVSSPPSFLPTSYLTLVQADGRTLRELRSFRHTWIQRIWEATCSNRPQARVRTLAGRRWNGPPQPGAMALDKDIAASLGLRIGSRLEFLSDGQPLTLRVAALVNLPPAEQVWGHGIFLDCAELKPAAYSGGVDVNPAQLSRVRRALHERFPEVTTMLLGELAERMHQLGMEAARALSIVAVLVVCVALVLLVAVIHSARAFRIAEIAILRAFGAQSKTLVVSLAAEFLALGAIAALTGAVAGCAVVIIGFWRITGIWKIGFSFGAVGVIASGIALLAAAVGVMVSLSLLRPRPLEILRRH